MEVVGVGGAIRAERNVLAQPINDPGFIDVVGRHLELHAVAGGQADEALAHFARNVGEDGVVVGQLHPEHGAGENGSDLPFEFDSFFRIHIFCGTGAPFWGSAGRRIKMRWLVAPAGWLTRPLFARARFVHGQGASLHFLAVEGVHGGIRLGAVVHGHERETAGAACRAIHHQRNVGDFAVLFEHVLEIILRRLKREITYVQFHLFISLEQKPPATEPFPRIGFQNHQ